MKRWIIAIMAGAGFSLGAPAQAEVFYSWVDVAQKPKLATLSDTFMRKQLCERSNIDGSCIDGGATNKDKALSPPPPEVTDPPPQLPPVSIVPLPPVIESVPLAPITAAPTTTPVPEPGSLSLLLLAALLLGRLLAEGARQRTQPPGSTYMKTTFVA